MTLLERFNEKWMPEPNSGCWLWCAAGNRDYGHMGIKRKTVSAHRISWKLHKGDIPAGMQVLHKCDVPACVNPDHLFLGDNDENMADKARKGRAAKKLTPQDVATIKIMVAGGLTQHSVAKAFGIGQHGVSFIVRGKRHQHLKGDDYGRA